MLYNKSGTSVCAIFMDIFYKKRNPSPWRKAALLLIIPALYFTTTKFFPDLLSLAQTPEKTAEEIAQQEFIQTKIFGYSTKQKPIEGLIVGKGQDVIFILSSIHGNEIGTTDLLNELIKNIRTTPDVVAKNKTLIIIPVANPDGYYDRIDNLNANEINLNLNFKTDYWKEYGTGGTYAGAKPFSEIESQVIKQIVEQYKPNLMIAYHSSGGVVSPEANTESKKISQWYAAKTGYEYYDGWDFAGTATRWFTESASKPSFTVELYKDLQSDWLINKAALLKLINTEDLASLQ